MIYLDTHIAVWLYMGDTSRLSSNAVKAVNKNDLLISPIVLLELTYLYEIGRLKTDAHTITGFLNKAIGLGICELPFEDVINSAVKQQWTRDPFDRIIVAHASGYGLVTKDEPIPVLCQTTKYSCKKNFQHTLFGRFLNTGIGS